MDATEHWTPPRGERPALPADTHARFAAVLPLPCSPPPALWLPASCPLAPPSRPLGASELAAQFKTPLLCGSMILGTFHLKDPQQVSLGKVMNVRRLTLLFLGGKQAEARSPPPGARPGGAAARRQCSDVLHVIYGTEGSSASRGPALRPSGFLSSPFPYERGQGFPLWAPVPDTQKV